MFGEQGQILRESGLPMVLPLLSCLSVCLSVYLSIPCTQLQSLPQIGPPNVKDGDPHDRYGSFLSSASEMVPGVVVVGGIVHPQQQQTFPFQGPCPMR